MCLNGVRGDWRGFVGEEQNTAARGARRRRCFGRGKVMRDGGLDLQAQGEAIQGVVVVRGVLWQCVDDGQGSPEWEEGVRRWMAGDEDRPGLFIGPD